MRNRPDHLFRRLVLPLALIGNLPQEIVLGPRQVGYFHATSGRTQCARDSLSPNRLSRGGGGQPEIDETRDLALSFGAGLIAGHRRTC